MMKLTERQMQALDSPANSIARIVNPRTNEKSVLRHIDEYERLKGDEYDDSPCTSAERHTPPGRRVSAREGNI